MLGRRQAVLGQRRDRKELEIPGAHLGPYCYPIAIDLLDRGLVTSQGIVTHGYAIGEWDEAIRVANSLDAIKVLKKPGKVLLKAVA